MEKNPTSSFKTGGILDKKKTKSQWVAGTFSETTSEAKCSDKARRGEIKKKKIKKKKKNKENRRRNKRKG